MDGRKAVGGSIEVKLRVRNPFQGHQVEEVKEKWLIIDQFERSLPAVAPKRVIIIIILITYKHWLYFI
jgi:coiled-coil and C2 domain-containing protein 1